MALDKSSTQPYYEQIAANLRQKIRSGEYSPGSKLPSEKELTGEWETTRTTIRQAVRRLITEGLARSEKGVGVFVQERGPVRRLSNDRFSRSHRKAGKAALVAEAEQQGVAWATEITQLEETPATATIAAHLNVEEGDPVFARGRRIVVNETATQLATSYFPLDIAIGQIREENTGPGGVYARIEDAGYELSNFVEELSARMPTPDEMQALNLAREGAPVVDLTRIAYSGDKVVEYFEAVMNASQHRYVYEFEAS